MDTKILIAQISLHYESRGTILHEWTRERYSRELNEKKRQPSDWYYKRITPAMAEKIQDETSRNICRQQYDKAIMSKYNVDKNYRQNRWFMEQVRPTIN